MRRPSSKHRLLRILLASTLLPHLSNAQICTFCEDGIPDPFITVQGVDQTTCADVQIVASELASDDELCALLKDEENTCCPRISVTLPTAPVSESTTASSAMEGTVSPTVQSLTSLPPTLKPTTIAPTLPPTNQAITTSSPTSLVTLPPLVGTGIISGEAFYDSNSNGNRESVQEYGVWNVQSSLYSCGDDATSLAATSTSTQGTYQFENLVGGSYYIKFEYPTYYLLSSVWNGDPSTSSVDNSANPENGLTNCFTLDDGGQFKADVALTFNPNPSPATATPPPTAVVTPPPSILVITPPPTAVSTEGATPSPTVAATQTPTGAVVNTTSSPPTLMNITATSSPTVQSIMNTTTTQSPTAAGVPVTSSPTTTQSVCTFCEDGIPDEEFVPANGGGGTCGEIKALTENQDVNSVICSILKQPESSCCPPTPPPSPPPSSSSVEDISCSFCQDGMPDPDYVVPGTRQTCADMQTLADDQVNNSTLCLAIQQVESSCCPPSSSSNTTTLSPTNMLTPSPSPQFDASNSSQPTAEFMSRICTFCEDGMVDETLGIPGREGETCRSQKDRAESVSGLTALCRTIQQAEMVCCPQPAVNPCTFCAEGIGTDDVDLVLPDSGGQTCGTVNALAGTIEQDDALCTTVKTAEILCCPPPAEFCAFCEGGLPSPEILVDGGQSCGSLQESAASVPGDSDLCDEFKAVEGQCCQIFTSPTISPLESTMSPTGNDSQPTLPIPSDLVGPVTRSGIEMLLVGIENTEKVTVWQENTAAFIMDYFKKNPGIVYDVNVNVTIMFQTASGARRSTAGPVRRQLQTPSVTITYIQTTTYKSKYPESYAYDEDYIAEEPFKENPEGYIAMLQRLSSYYDPVTKVSVTVPPSTPPPSPSIAASTESEVGDITSNNKKKGIFIGVVVAVVLIAVVAGVLIVRKRKRRNQNEENNASQTLTRQVGSDEDLENRDLSGGAFESEGALAAAAALQKLSSSKVIRSGDSESTVQVIAPEGKLGVVVATSPQGGPARVVELREDSPLLGEILLGDKIIAIDDEDVQQLSSIDVSKMIARKCRNPQRKFTILREKDEQELDPSSPGANDPLVDVPTPPDESSDQAVTIIAPAGKLGLVLQNNKGGGPAYVSEIREGSVMEGKVKLNDKVVSVDDEDVRELKAFHISKILASKNENSERKIVMLRAANNASDVIDV